MADLEGLSGLCGSSWSSGSLSWGTLERMASLAVKLVALEVVEIVGGFGNPVAIVDLVSWEPCALLKPK